MKWYTAASMAAIAFAAVLFALLVAFDGPTWPLVVYGASLMIVNVVLRLNGKGPLVSSERA
jgi:hypothetical protein